MTKTKTKTKTSTIVAELWDLPQGLETEIPSSTVFSKSLNRQQLNSAFVNSFMDCKNRFSLGSKSPIGFLCAYFTHIIETSDINPITRFLLDNQSDILNSPIKWSSILESALSTDLNQNQDTDQSYSPQLQIQVFLLKHKHLMALVSQGEIETTTLLQFYCEVSLHFILLQYSFEDQVIISLIKEIFSALFLTSNAIFRLIPNPEIIIKIGAPLTQLSGESISPEKYTRLLKYYRYQRSFILPRYLSPSEQPIGYSLLDYTISLLSLPNLDARYFSWDTNILSQSNIDIHGESYLLQSLISRIKSILGQYQLSPLRFGLQLLYFWSNAPLSTWSSYLDLWKTFFSSDQTEQIVHIFLVLWTPWCLLPTHTKSKSNAKASLPFHQFSHSDSDITSNPGSNFYSLLFHFVQQEIFPLRVLKSVLSPPKDILNTHIDDFNTNIKNSTRGLHQFIPLGQMISHEEDHYLNDNEAPSISHSTDSSVQAFDIAIPHPSSYLPSNISSLGIPILLKFDSNNQVKNCTSILPSFNRNSSLIIPYLFSYSPSNINSFFRITLQPLLAIQKSLVSYFEENESNEKKPKTKQSETSTTTTTVLDKLNKKPLPPQLEHILDLFPPFFDFLRFNFRQNESAFWLWDSASNCLFSIWDILISLSSKHPVLFKLETQFALSLSCLLYKKPSIFYSFCRRINTIVKDQPDLVSQLLSFSILPSLSLLSVDPFASNLVWEIISKFSREKRITLYTSWEQFYNDSNTDNTSTTTTTTTESDPHKTFWGLFGFLTSQLKLEISRSSRFLAHEVFDVARLRLLKLGCNNPIAVSDALIARCTTYSRDPAQISFVSAILSSSSIPRMLFDIFFIRLCKTILSFSESKLAENLEHPSPEFNALLTLLIKVVSDHPHYHGFFLIFVNQFLSQGYSSGFDLLELVSRLHIVTRWISDLCGFDPQLYNEVELKDIDNLFSSTPLFFIQHHPSISSLTITKPSDIQVSGFLEGEWESASASFSPIKHANLILKHRTDVGKIHYNFLFSLIILIAQTISGIQNWLFDGQSIGVEMERPTEDWNTLTTILESTKSLWFSLFHLWSGFSSLEISNSDTMKYIPPEYLFHLYRISWHVYHKEISLKNQNLNNYAILSEGTWNPRYMLVSNKLFGLTDLAICENHLSRLIPPSASLTPSLLVLFWCTIPSDYLFEESTSSTGREIDSQVLKTLSKSQIKIEKQASTRLIEELSTYSTFPAYIEEFLSSAHNNWLFPTSVKYLENTLGVTSSSGETTNKNTTKTKTATTNGDDDDDDDDDDGDSNSNSNSNNDRSRLSFFNSHDDFGGDTVYPFMPLFGNFIVSIHQSHFDLLKYCIIPRVLESFSGAIFSFKFISALADFSVPNFSIFHLFILLFSNHQLWAQLFSSSSDQEMVRMAIFSALLWNKISGSNFSRTTSGASASASGRLDKLAGTLALPLKPKQLITILSHHSAIGEEEEDDNDTEAASSNDIVSNAVKVVYTASSRSATLTTIHPQKPEHLVPLDESQFNLIFAQYHTKFTDIICNALRFSIGKNPTNHSNVILAHNVLIFLNSMEQYQKCFKLGTFMIYPRITSCCQRISKLARKLESSLIQPGSRYHASLLALQSNLKSYSSIPLSHFLYASYQKQNLSLTTQVLQDLSLEKKTKSKSKTSRDGVSSTHQKGKSREPSIHKDTTTHRSSSASASGTSTNPSTLSSNQTKSGSRDPSHRHDRSKDRSDRSFSRTRDISSSRDRRDREWERNAPSSLNRSTPRNRDSRDIRDSRDSRDSRGRGPPPLSKITPRRDRNPDSNRPLAKREKREHHAPRDVRDSKQGDSSLSRRGPYGKGSSSSDRSDRSDRDRSNSKSDANDTNYRRRGGRDHSRDRDRDRDGRDSRTKRR